MPEAQGLKALKLIKNNHPDLPLVALITDHVPRETFNILKQNAIDHISKPLSTEQVNKVFQALLKSNLSRKTKEKQSDQSSDDTPGIITASSEMINELEILQKVAETDVSVLIEGESGTGKELAALALHDKSKRKDKSFLSINCAAIPENLIEAELFGYEKGAFTGAHVERKGFFELANQGTFFLDEIGEMPLHLQSKILRVLEEKKINKIGGSKKISIDVRTVFATNKNLWDEVKKGNFREDLYFRLAVVHITLPPIRKRPEDIDLLVNYFLNYFSMKYDKPMKMIEKEAMNWLLNYPWPGNVRELKNYIERIVILENDEILHKKHIVKYFPSQMKTIKKHKIPKSPIGHEILKEPTGSKSLKEEMTNLERTMIIQALKKFNGNKTKAAASLKISRRSLQIKVKNLHIDEPF
jgi:DNA-binding NtrC family response regulator